MRLQIGFYPNVMARRRLLETLDSAYAESNLFFIGFHFPMLFDQNSFIGQFSQPSFRCQVQYLDICCIRAEGPSINDVSKDQGVGPDSWGEWVSNNVLKRFLFKDIFTTGIFSSACLNLQSNAFVVFMFFKRIFSMGQGKSLTEDLYEISQG